MNLGEFVTRLHALGWKLGTAYSTEVEGRPYIEVIIQTARKQEKRQDEMIDLMMTRRREGYATDDARMYQDLLTEAEEWNRMNRGASP